MTTRLPWLLLLALAGLWGGSFMLAKIAVVDIPPLTLVLARVGLAAIALWVVVAAMRLPVPRDRRTWAALAVLGLLNNVVPFTLIFWGQTRIDSGLASILNATTPLFTVLLAHLVTVDERLTWPRLTGVLLGIAGVVVIIGPPALAGLAGDLLGQLAVVAAALSYACAGLWGRRLRAHPPLVIAAGMVSMSTLVMLGLAGLVDRPWTLPAPSAAAVAATLTLALVCTALAYLLYFRILALAGATSLALVTFLIPPAAILLGVVVLGERLAGTDGAGMGLIGLGLAAIDGRLMMRRQRPVTSG